MTTFDPTHKLRSALVKLAAQMARQDGMPSTYNEDHPFPNPPHPHRWYWLNQLAQAEKMVTAWSHQVMQIVQSLDEAAMTAPNPTPVRRRGDPKYTDPAGFLSWYEDPSCSDYQSMLERCIVVLGDVKYEEDLKLDRIDALLEVLRKIDRIATMSAGVMRDSQRTGGWDGAERVARAFDRIAKCARIDAVLPKEPQP